MNRRTITITVTVVLVLASAIVLAAGVKRAVGDAANYARSLANVLVHEGGFSNHPSDPGRATLQGITQARYDQFRTEHGLAMRELTPALLKDKMWPQERASIYRIYYADAIRFDDLPRGVDYTAFDYAVNSGPGRAGKVLRCVVQVAMPVDDCVRASKTWQISDPIIEALKHADIKHIIREVNDERSRFVHRLSTCRVFCSGWDRRIGSVRSISIIMSGGLRADSYDLRPFAGPGKALEQDELMP